MDRSKFNGNLTNLFLVKPEIASLQFSSKVPTFSQDLNQVLLISNLEEKRDEFNYLISDGINQTI